MKKFAILFFVLLFPSLLYIFLTKGKHNFTVLPIYGPKQAIVKTVNGKEITDTNYHEIPDFTFTNHLGKQIVSDTTTDKIFVTNFFFSTCKSICIPMNQEMNRLYNRFKNDGDVKFYSITVDPEKDSVSTLKDYSEQFNLTNDKWDFLTGNKSDIYRLAEKKFFLTAIEDTTIPDFIHDDRIVLIDAKRRIRGYYKGTDNKEVDKLIDEIKVLKAEAYLPLKNQ